MAEQIANRAETTLAAAVSVEATTVEVNNATRFPATGDFRLVVGREIMLVTAVTSKVFTVTRGVEGTEAEYHSKGAAAVCALTKGSLEELLDGSGAEVHVVGSAGEPEFETYVAKTSSFEPELLNGWEAAEAEYGFDSENNQNFVWIDGATNSESSDDVLFTLPADFWPAEQVIGERFIVDTNGDFRPVEAAEEIESEEVGWPPQPGFEAFVQVEADPVAFSKSRSVVTLQGVAEYLGEMQEGAIVVYTLPTGYRPPTNIILPAVGSEPRVVKSNGDVLMAPEELGSFLDLEGEAYVAFTGISFRAAE